MNESDTRLNKHAKKTAGCRGQGDGHRDYKAMNSRIDSRRAGPRRGGVILMLVLTMLTLFLLIGAAGLTAANRTRASARAFASAASNRGSRDALAKSALDEALLKLVRGPSITGKMTESLLGDKYGDPMNSVGTLTAIAAEAGTPLLKATITGVDVSNPMSLNGRVVTFAPRGANTTAPLSFRILRVATGGIFWLANFRPLTPTRLPSLPCDAIINGREFEAEPWDAFDTQNAFLARPTLNAQQQLVTVQPSFPLPVMTSAAIQVDNDNDGVNDGIWLTGTTDFFPSLTSQSGGEIKFSVSYLVLDLDGRLNVNAHGRPTGTTDPMNGPATIDGSMTVNGSSMIPQAAWQLLMTGGRPLGTGTTSTAQNWRPSPIVTTDVDGRYGRLTNVPSSMSPYELRLDPDAPRVSTLRKGTGQNPFTVGEFERVLRLYDSDAGSLPTRLAAILDSSGQRSRLLATTDSWDTPGVTGTAAINIASAPDPDALSPDVATGLRFDLNRTWNGNSASDRKDFCEDLHAVVSRALPATPATGRPPDQRIAQWVANVVAFRDNDSSQVHQYTLPSSNGGTVTVTGMEPPNNPAPLGLWNDGRIMSAADLLAIPFTTQQEFQDLLNAGTHTTLKSLAEDRPEILDAVIVPSPFASSRLSVPRTSLQAVGMQDLLDNQLSRWREPGKVNVNTCPNAVWALFAPNESASSNPFLNNPARNNRDILTRALTDATCVNIATTKRVDARLLSNVATVRSQVFAIWITVKIEDTAPSADPPSYHRLFAIVDRSIPVGYRPGHNLNVRDTIRLQHFLE